MITFQKIRRSLTPAQRGSLYYLAFFLSMGSFSPFLNIYYLDLGFTGQQIGILAIFFPLMNFLFATPLSALADRKGWRIQVLQVSIFGSAIFVFLLKIPSTFGLIAIFLAILAFFASPILSIADGLIANMAANHSLNYGSMRLWGSIGFAISASVFGIVWQRFDFAPMFLVGALLFIPIFVVGSSLNPGAVAAQTERQPISSVFKDVGLVILIATAFLMGISDGLARTFEGIYVLHLGGGNMLVGLMIGFSASSEILTMQFGQKISSRLKNAHTLILSFGLSGVAYIGYALAPGAGWLLPLAIFKGLGFGLFFPTIVRIVNERAPKEWVTTAQSLRSVAMFGLAPLLAGPLGGWIMDSISPQSIFVVSFSALGVAALLVGVAKARRILD
jgi:MFS transporter, PPP family, 3-phenylpropionic acid transporter